MCDFREVKGVVQGALRRLYRDDSQLFEHNVNERSITHSLAAYLQESYPAWNVDCEYNRNGTDPKRRPVDPVQVSSADTNGKTVYPDIIVHHRGLRGRGANLLVLEAKKAWSAGSPDDDRGKLVAFGRSEDFSYSFGALLLLNRTNVEIEWYRNGVASEESELLDVSAEPGRDAK